MDQYLWRVPKVLWRYQWSQSIIAGRGYTATYCFSVDTPTIIFEHLRMAFIKFANPEKNFVPSSKLELKVRQRRPSTKSTCPFTS
jgi:hypothetical protein